MSISGEVWICGQMKEWFEDASRWEFAGVFSTEKKADIACRDKTYFIFPQMIDERIPHETCEPERCRYPRVLEGRK